MASDLRAVDADFFATARHCFTNQAVISRPPEPVFEAIADDPAGWGNWFPGFDDSGRWLTPEPPGPGSRRRVRMGRLSYDETIIAWERPNRFAFRVDRASIPLARALAEDYRLSPHPSGCTFEWVFAVDLRPPFDRMAPIYGPVLARLFKKVAAGLERAVTA
jgi:hypothetical protein